MNRFGWALALLMLAASAHADEVDRYIEAQMQRQHVPGLAVAIVHNGRVEKLRGYGLADVERNVPATADTVFEIGSITKQFTSMAIMLLVERKRLGLDDPLGSHLGDVPEAWRAVTVRQLLTHTAGVPDYEEVMGYDSYRNRMTPQEVLAFVAKRPLDFAPGSRWKYSNTGYFLLTMILEKITGQPYATFVEQNILAPAGMRSTRSSEPSDVIRNRALGYEYTTQLRNRDAIQPSATGGAGMLVSTAGDMVRWASVISKRALLKPESYEAIFSDTRLTDGTMAGYGFGWIVRPMRDHRALSHSGQTAGFTANILVLPDDGVAIIALLNTATANPFNITDHIARSVVPSLRYTTLADPQPEVGQRLREFLAHRTDPAPYTAGLAKELIDAFAPYWSSNQAYFKLLGPPVGIELVERTDERHLRYRVRYRELSRLVSIVLDENGLISEMSASDE